MQNKQSRKELVAQYLEMKTRYGIFQLKNKVDGKIFIDSAKNLRAKENSYIHFLNNNMTNRDIMEDAKEHGIDNFEFSILEEHEIPDDPYFDMKTELDKMLSKWIEQLQPFDDKGYNKRPKNK